MIRAAITCSILVTASLVLAQTGAIEGTVKLLPRDDSQARIAARYPGQPGMVHSIPKTPIPAVVLVKETFEGQTSTPPTRHPSLGQKNAWFIPEVMAVLVGTTVDFPNLDNQYHNVFSYSKPKRFDLGRYPTGESRPVTFDKPGVVKIYCEIHEHMRAWVVVCENPYFAVTDMEGKFRIENVPAGKRTLMVWRAQGKEAQQDVNVVAGQIVTGNFE